MKDNRNRLETVARDSVQRSGLKGLSFRTLADEVGIKSSSVHYYFPEKADLAQALIERYSHDVFEKLAEIEGKRWNVRKKLNAFISIFEEVGNENCLCLCGMMAAELESLSDDNRTRLSAFFTGMESWLVALLDAHRDDLQSSLASTQLAKSLIGGLQGALLLDRAVGNNQRLKAQKELILSLLH